jgi:hypothetical protein
MARSAGAGSSGRRGEPTTRAASVTSAGGLVAMGALSDGGVLTGGARMGRTAGTVSDGTGSESGDTTVLATARAGAATVVVGVDDVSPPTGGTAATGRGRMPGERATTNERPIGTGRTAVDGCRPVAGGTTVDDSGTEGSWRAMASSSGPPP